MMIQPPEKASIIAIKGTLREQRAKVYRYLNQTDIIAVYIDCWGQICRSNPSPRLPSVLYIHEHNSRTILSLLKELRNSLSFSVIIFDPVHGLYGSDFGSFLSVLCMFFPHTSCIFFTDHRFEMLFQYNLLQSFTWEVNSN